MPESLPVSKAWLHRPHLFVFFWRLSRAPSVLYLLFVAIFWRSGQGEGGCWEVFVFAFSQALVKPRKQKGGRGDGERRGAATLSLSAVFLDFLRLRQQEDLGRYLSAARDVHMF